MLDLNAEVESIYKINMKWRTDLQTGEIFQRPSSQLLMLLITEVAEAFEGERKNLDDSHLPQFKAVEVEMADVLIRVFDYMGEMKFRFGTMEKPEYISIPDDKFKLYMDIVKSIGRVDDYMINPKNDTPRYYAVQELQNLVCMIFTYCFKNELKLLEAYFAKKEYNIKRADHSHEERKKQHGKQF